MRLSIELKRINNLMLGSSFEETNQKAVPSKLFEMLGTKIERTELEDKLLNKCNKTDLEMLFRQISIIHKQLEQLVHLFTSDIRLQIEAGNQVESE